MNKKIDDLFIVGTDTGVGKTVLSLLLMQYFYARGYKPFYLKPLQTGCIDPYDTESDAGFIYKHVKKLIRKDPADSVINCFKAQKAPLFAARDEGQKIDFGKIQKVVEKKRHSYTPLIIEAAGGLLVPVNENMLMIDAIKLLNAKPILVARAGLGTINHTLLSLEALSRRGIQSAGIVFMDAATPPTPEEMVKENIEAVEKVSGIKIGSIIGKIQDFSRPAEDCFKSFEGIFGNSIKRV